MSTPAAFATACFIVAASVTACGAFLGIDGADENRQPGPDGDASDDALDGARGAEGGANGGDGGGDGGDAGRFPFTVLTTEITKPYYLEIAGTDLLVATRDGAGGVYKLATSGGPATKIGQRPAFGLAISGGDVFFCNENSFTGPGLVYVPLAGGTNVPLTSEYCLEVAVQGDYVYFTGGDRDVVERIQRDGGGRTTISAGADGPEGIASDGTSIYYAQLHGGQLTKVLPDGGDVSLAQSMLQPRRVVLRDGYLYWVEYLSSNVRRVKADQTGALEELGTGPAETRSGSIAVDDTYVYWVVSWEKGPSTTSSRPGGGGLYRAPRGGGGPVETVIDDLDRPVGVVVDSTYLYLTVWNENRVLKITK